MAHLAANDGGRACRHRHGVCALSGLQDDAARRARVTVMDTQSQPVSDARVVLISSSYPYGRERSRLEVRTMPTGKASFSAQTEWRVESLMLHGSEIYFWNWCIEKTGYETYETLNNAASQFDDTLIVQLPPGESRSCDRP